MLFYLLSLIILIAFILAYFRFADRYNIIDKPNERSSHDYITIHGGGIIFPIAALLWFLMFDFQQPWIVLALMLISVISFVDDMMVLSSKIRILVHIIAVTVLLWQNTIFGLPWYGIVAAYIITLGWINAFNFMDGVNGMTAFYALVALITFGWLNTSFHFMSHQLLVLIVLSVVIFSFFNARKQARAFAGDVGSISMAFLLGWFMIALMQTTGRVEYILLFSVYGIDSAITILYRLQRGENIFEAHRSHLYQYLCNELQWPHLKVSAIYALTQAILNGFTITLIRQEWMSWPVFSAFLFMQVLVYLVVRHRVSKRIEVAG